ncbi:MAG TPA: hypothetical protein VNF50_13820 [Acidimicrobiales bacterium]|nr:hypothetical protein [Acidimicrobiales bacterium]
MTSPATVNVLIHVGPSPSSTASSPTAVTPTNVAVPTATTVPGGPAAAASTPPAGIPASLTPAVPRPTPSSPLPVATVHLPAGRPPAGALPFTGLDAIFLLILAACLIGAGLLFHLLARQTAVGWGSGPTGMTRREAA